MINSQDHEEQQLSSPPPSHRLHRRPNHFQISTDLARKALTKPKVYIALLMISSFLLGYISQTTNSRDLLQHNRFTTQPCANPIPPSNIRQTILDRVFSGASPYDNFPPAHVSPLLYKNWTKGWGSTNPVFEHLIRKVRPETIIEVGTFLGASANHMARLTRELGLDTQIICIDDFRGWPGYYDDGKSLKMVNGDSMLLYQFMQNVADINATGSILFMPFSTSTALGGLCEWGVYGDLVEVDAAHDFHSAWVDINNAYRVLKPGGVLFGHDYAWAGVRYAVDLFARANGFRVRLDGKHWILH